MNESYPIDWTVLRETLRTALCCCAHERQAHACTFNGVRCIWCGCNCFHREHTGSDSTDGAT